MEKGRLRREGESLANMEEKENSNKQIISNDVMLDNLGNVIKIKREDIIDKKQLKKEMKYLQKQMKTAKKEGNVEEALELECKIDDIKEKIKT